MMAVARGDLTTLKKLIEWGIDLNKYTVDEITPVMLAAKQGQSVRVEAAEETEPTDFTNLTDLADLTDITDITD